MTFISNTLKLSLLAALAAAFVEDKAAQAFVDLALLVALAAVAVLLLFGPRKPKATKRPARSPGKPILVDGSNVMHWSRGQPDLQTVKSVLTSLHNKGYPPLVWFDANAGYLVENRYMQPKHLAWKIGLPTRSVRIAPKGTPADPLILDEARQSGVPIITNDRFRDWQEQFPEIANTDRLVRGGFDGAAVRLHLH